MATKTGVVWGIGVAPFPAGIFLAQVQVPWRRQGGRNLVAGSRNGHGSRRTVLMGHGIAVERRGRIIYLDTGGGAGGRHWRGHAAPRKQEAGAEAAQAAACVGWAVNKYCAMQCSTVMYRQYKQRGVQCRAAACSASGVLLSFSSVGRDCFCWPG